MKKQVSESFLNSAILAVSGGLQDAYTYNIRDHVFANAQTGNIVLLSQNLMSGNFRIARSYLVPVLAFAAGVFLAERVEYRFKQARKLHWRQGVLLAEILLLFLVGFIPAGWNAAANALVSFACAMQVQSFRTVNGNGFASTMCIGNLRSGTVQLSKFLRTGNKAQLDSAINYFGIIMVFGTGAGVGGLLTIHTGYRAIWVSCLLLSVSFILMFRREKGAHSEKQR
ncbi:MAG: DUF1275 domain-containing protein [Treponemataceae bacterium]|nr:DUF1275 domain-containing protein [Treponemataceae bacterium]